MCVLIVYEGKTIKRSVKVMLKRLRAAIALSVICLMLAPQTVLAARAHTSLTVYYTFSAPTDFHLVPVTVLIPQTQNPAQRALELLIQGPPEGSFLHRNLPANTVIRSLSVADGLATVDFSQEVTAGAGGSSAEALLLAAVTNTLCSLEGIERVQILVEGQKTSVGGHIEATEPFTYNRNIVIRQPFTDISGHWAEGNVNAFFLTGMVEGYGDGTFRPERTVNRAEFVKLLTLAAGHSQVTPAQPTFTDVPAGHWAYGYVEAAVKAGILLPADYGTGFKPEANLSRQEMAVLLVRAARKEQRAIELRDADLAYSDTAELASWAKGYIGVAAELKFMHGDPRGTFRPKATSTRAEATAVLTRYLGMGEQNVRLVFPREGEKVGDWVLIGGVARAFEATVLARILDEQGQEHAAGFTTATEGGPGWGFFAVMMPAPAGTEVTVEAYTESMKDGSVQDLVTRRLSR